MRSAPTTALLRRLVSLSDKADSSSERFGRCESLSLNFSVRARLSTFDLFIVAENMRGLASTYSHKENILEIPLTLFQGCDGCVYLCRFTQVGIRASTVGYSHVRSACAPLERCSHLGYGRNASYTRAGFMGGLGWC